MGKTNTRLSVVAGLVAMLFLAETTLSSAQEHSHPVVVKATRHASAPPLSQLAPLSLQSRELTSLPGDEDQDDEGRPMHGLRLGSPVQDSVLQSSVVQASFNTTISSALPSLSTTSGLNILGVGVGFPGYSTQASVPDTNGAVGTTQYVQFVNDSFAVFNKSTGSVAYGPATGNTLFQGLGAPCASNPNLDETVQFDQLANRWVVLMPVGGAPPYLCVAVSTTSDAVNGGWNLYSFQPPVSKLCGCRLGPDYAKLTVWPDGYYITYNASLGGSYEGPYACAVNRNAVLSGAAATMQCFTNVGSSYGSLLAADLDGSTPPPAGSAEYLLDFNGNDQSLDLWKFHVDWMTPANSTITGPTNIPVAAFTEPCGETVVQVTYTTGGCVPQAGTSQGLDSYGDRLMYRLAYRNLGSHESLVANHTVQTGTNGTQTGIRWYELQNTGSGFGLHQQGTFAPDSSYRWMGSIAMDKAGDIALGYNTSSSTMNPSIRYTGRLSTDSLGQMESEIDVLSAAGVAHGSQTNTFHWADYASLSIDPTDDCTFWFTTEYLPTTGGHWSTRIASFSFPSCSGSYTLTANEMGQGTVTGADGVINCVNGSGTCSALYPSGSSVTLTATAASGWTFSGWSGGCSGPNPCNVVMTSNWGPTATFATATQTYTLTTNESGQGTVTSTDGAINCTNGTGSCSAVYPSGTTVTLNATPTSGWTFSGWSGVCTGANPCNVTMTQNWGPQANFTTIASWAIVNKASKSGSPLTSLTIPATGSGNLIAVALMFNGTTSVAKISDNAGNTYVSAGARATNGPQSTEIWYALNSKSRATVVAPTFVGSPTHVEMTTWEVSGIPNLLPDAKSISSGSVTLNNTPGPAVTTSQAGDFIISILFANTADFTAITSGNEFTDDFTTFGNGWAHITSNAASAGTHQASWYTASPAGAYCASTVAFFP
jgi:uncharacterized repeat protein (TIGR02543 family)